MQKSNRAFMLGTLDRWMYSIALVSLMIVSVCHGAQDSDEVQIILSVGTYLHVDIDKSIIDMDPVQPEEFYMDPGLEHYGSSMVTIITNRPCYLRTAQNAVLTHASGEEAPLVPITASVSLQGTNTARSRFLDGIWYWVMNFDPGISTGVTLVVRAQQMWTAEHLAGIYSGDLTVELFEGEL